MDRRPRHRRHGAGLRRLAALSRARSRSPNARVAIVLSAPDTPDLAGDYVLTIAASASCTFLPDNVRHRAYAATLSPDGNQSSWIVRLDGTFTGGRVAGTVAAARNAARVSLSQFDDFFNEERAVVERTANGYVTFQGSADLVIAPGAQTAAGDFAGVVGHCPVAVASSCAVAPAFCSAPDHGLTLIRR